MAKKETFEHIGFKNKKGEIVPVVMSYVPAPELRIDMPLSLGVEIEFHVLGFRGGCDDQRLAPVSAERMVASFNDLMPGGASGELFENMLEVRAGGPQCTTLADFYCQLVAVHQVALEVARKHDTIITTESLLPVPGGRLNDWLPFMRGLIQDRYRYGGLCNDTAAGTQYHVGIPDGGLAVFTHNAYCQLSHLTAALTTNSPFANGKFMGGAGMRNIVRLGSVNSGIPYVIQGGDFKADLDHAFLCYSHGITKGMRGRWNTSYPRYDLGTMEFGDCDNSAIFTTILMADFFRRLTMALYTRYITGTPLPWFLQPQHESMRRENLNRACQSGMQASFFYSNLPGEVNASCCLLESKEGGMVSARDLFKTVLSWVLTTTEHFPADTSIPGWDLKSAFDDYLGKGTLGEQKLHAFAELSCRSCRIAPEIIGEYDKTQRLSCHAMCNDSAVAWHISGAINKIVLDFASRHAEDVQYHLKHPLLR